MNQKNTTISAIILARNEEDRIAKCLLSLAWVDERLVVDNGSTDKTSAIARKYKAIVYQSSENDFSKLRTLGKDKASGDWVLYVDADEELTDELRDEIQRLTSTFNVDIDSHGYFIKRKNLYLGYPWPYQDRLERLFWKKSLIGWRGELHETAIVKGTLATLNAPLLHNTHRNLKEMIEKTNQWSEIEAKLRLEAHHPKILWWRFLRVMFTAFFDSFIRQKGWRAGEPGWIESIYQAFSIFITYAKLWEMQAKREKRQG